MISFWILAAGLIGLALLFVVPPLVSRRAERPDVDRDALRLYATGRDLGDGDVYLRHAGRDRQTVNIHSAPPCMEAL